MATYMYAYAYYLCMYAYVKFAYLWAALYKTNTSLLDQVVSHFLLETELSKLNSVYVASNVLAITA